MANINNMGVLLTTELENIDISLHHPLTGATYTLRLESTNSVKDDINTLLKVFDGRTNVNEHLIKKVLLLKKKCKTKEHLFYKLKQMKYFKNKLK